MGLADEPTTFGGRQQPLATRSWRWRK
jgi:hypothetical protein